MMIPVVLLGVFVVVFLGCSVSQFWFYRRIRQVLVERHPELWLSLSYKAWSVDSALMRFAFSRKGRDLGDPILNARVKEARVMLLVGLAAWLAMVVALVFGVGLAGQGG